MATKNDLIGKTLAEIKIMAGDNYDNFRYRVVAEDGVSYAVTCDWRPERFNLRLEDGKVIAVSMG